MAENIRVSKIMRFGVNIVRKKFDSEESDFFSFNYKDSDYLNYIVDSWLRQNYTENELSDMGYDDVIGK